MNSALFTYNRTEKVNNQEVVNANYINPMHVISMYWAISETGTRVLNIFTSAVVADDKGGSKTMRVTFGERTGERFVEHVEAFHTLLLNAPQQRAASPSANNERKPRSYNHVIDPDSDIQGDPEFAFEGAQA